MGSLNKKYVLLYFTELFSLITFIVFSISLEYMPPNRRDFDVNDKSIDFPFTEHEVVSAFMLPVRKNNVLRNLYFIDFIFSYLIWLFLLLFYYLQPWLTDSRTSECLWRFWVSCRECECHFALNALGLYFTISLAFLFTNIFKVRWMCSGLYLIAF